MAARKPSPCIGCGLTIDINQKALVMFIGCQTVGIQPRQKGTSERLYLCSRCTARVALNDKPSKSHPVEVAMYNMIVRLVGGDPAVIRAAWEHLNQVVQGVPALHEVEIIPPAKRLKEAS
jgi:hypothetical protein